MHDCRIAPLRPSELQFSYANPPGADDVAAARRVPATFMLNTRDGFEVLYLVNRFSTEYGGGERTFALRAERLIRDHLPAGVRVCRQVDDWLLQHWSLGASCAS
jgi:hypothetical protein